MESALDIEGGLECRESGGVSSTEGIALCAEDNTAISLDSLAQNGVVALHGNAHL
jgi:hypothetical protein